MAVLDLLAKDAPSDWKHDAQIRLLPNVGPHPIADAQGGCQRYQPSPLVNQSPPQHIDTEIIVSNTVQQT